MLYSKILFLEICSLSKKTCILSLKKKKKSRILKTGSVFGAKLSGSATLVLGSIEVSRSMEEGGWVKASLYSTRFPILNFCTTPLLRHKPITKSFLHPITELSIGDFLGAELLHKKLCPSFFLPQSIFVPIAPQIVRVLSRTIARNAEPCSISAW